MAKSKSPSSRRAWIEIIAEKHSDSGTTVALLAEGVDRNDNDTVIGLCRYVALLAEGVDRNWLKRWPIIMRLGRPPRGGRG